MNIVVIEGLGVGGMVGEGIEKGSVGRVGFWLGGTVWTVIMVLVIFEFS